MGFNEDKRKALKKFQEALDKNEVDRPIIPLLKLINSLEDFYTTSSCAGRVILLYEFGSRKKDHNFILKEHEEINIEKFLNKDIEELRGRIWLKQEPFIIHIVARSLEKAIEMLNLGLRAGLKHSGIFIFKRERYIIELNGTQHLSVPIFDNGKILISKEYFVYILKLANEKLQKNKEIRNRFENLIREYGS